MYCLLVFFLITKFIFIFILWVIWLQMSLGFPVLHPLFCSDQVTSGFLAQSGDGCWIPSLVIGVLVHDCLIQV